MMKLDETTQKWLPENEEEQKFFDYAFNKGYGQAKKSEPTPAAQPPKQAAPNVVEEPKTNNFNLEAIQQMIMTSVSQVIAPIQNEFVSLKTTQQEALKQAVIAKQATKLPQTYLSLIKGETEQDIAASYEQVATQYQNELKALGITSSFGAPTPTNTNPSPANNKKFSQMTNAEKIELCKSDPQLYARLKNQN